MVRIDVWLRQSFLCIIYRVCSNQQIVETRFTPEHSVLLRGAAQVCEKMDCAGSQLQVRPAMPVDPHLKIDKERMYVGMMNYDRLFPRNCWAPAAPYTVLIICQRSKWFDKMFTRFFIKIFLRISAQEHERQKCE